MNWSDVQSFMQARALDAWIVHDFRGSNAVLARLLPPPPGEPKRRSTRRATLVIPASGRPALIAHRIDAIPFADVPARFAADLDLYISWRDWQARLAPHARGRVAMEYSPGGALPVVGTSDAGTVELVRALGAEVVSSADLIQHAVSRWSPDAVREHLRASVLVDAIKDEAFALIRDTLARGSTLHEHDAAQFIRDRFAAHGLEYPDGPIVSVNEHAADPHYEPSPAHPREIRPGDWVLIDLWARIPGDHNVHADITWVGYLGRDVPDLHTRVARTVFAARDAALALAKERFARGRRVEGWELDDAARAVIVDAGFERGLVHRTGHSLSPGEMVHGSGMNLDNLETRDTREMLPGTGFTIEPGIYLPDERLGVRSEINVYVDPAKGPIVTSRVQSDVLRLGERESTGHGSGAA